MNSVIRKLLVHLVPTVLLATVSFAEAQQPGKVPRIGMLVNGTSSSHKFMVDEFKEGLRDLGYVDGKSFLLEIEPGD